jgi:hypothetical protein
MRRVSLIALAFAWRECTAVDRPGRASLRVVGQDLFGDLALLHLSHV